MDSAFDPVFYTATQVSQAFFHGRVSYQNVLSLTRQGKLPAIKRGKSYLYERHALEEWVKTNFGTPAWSGIKVIN